MATQISTIHMLILDPSSNDAEQTINILRNSGHPVRANQILSEEDLELALEKQKWDLFIVRDNLENPSAEQCLKIVQHYGSDIPFIMISSEYSVERTLEALRLGMKDVLPKGNDEYFKLVVERELSSIADRRNRKLADKALLETTKRNELLLESSRDAIAYITDGMHIYANHAYIELFGYDDGEDLECLPIMDLMESHQHDEFKKYFKNHTKGKTSEDFKFNGLDANGATFDALLSLSDSKYDGEDCTQVIIKTADVSDEQLEQKLKELSAQDLLTGLYNQQYFIDALRAAIDKAGSESQLSAVFYMELDNYDSIQNEHGIQNSDTYLKEVSHWLTKRLPNQSILARIGDCTFSVLVFIQKPDEAEMIANKLCKQFSSHMFEIDMHTIADSLSIGICPVQETSPVAEKILSNAHFACSGTQSKGGNGIRLYDTALDSLDNREDAQIAMELQDAKDANKLHLMFEPIVKLHGDVQHMFNVKLAIDTDQAENLLIDNIFNIGILTTTALKLDEWLMTAAFEEFAEYVLHHPNCKMKLQLRAASLLNENLISNVCGLLEQYNLPANSLIIEFREDDVTAHLKRAIEIIKTLGEKGLFTALSGFGSTLDPQSIVNAINCHHFKWLTIDIPLLDKLNDAKVQEKIQQLASFAQVNELSVIAPSISDPGSLAILWPMNIGHIHGDYIASISPSMDFDFSEVSF